MPSADRATRVPGPTTRAESRALALLAMLRSTTELVTLKKKKVFGLWSFIAFHPWTFYKLMRKRKTKVTARSILGARRDVPRAQMGR